MRTVALVVLLTLGLMACSGNDVVLEVEIGPELVKCGGLIPDKCIVMDGEPLYESIEGFDYEEGYAWTLKIRRREPWGEDGPPQTEMSNYTYHLIEIISKVPE